MVKRSPSQAARAQCIVCMNGNRQSITDCPSVHCILYSYRNNRGGGRLKLKTIRNYCLHCCGWPIKDMKLDKDYKHGRQSFMDARDCTGKDCPFYRFRPGQTPYSGIRKGNGDMLHKKNISQPDRRCTFGT